MTFEEMKKIANDKVKISGMSAMVLDTMNSYSSARTCMPTVCSFATPVCPACSVTGISMMITRWTD